MAGFAFRSEWEKAEFRIIDGPLSQADDQRSG